nr:hypothetical protein Q903MT_gene628 [Picea sitchensis]
MTFMFLQNSLLLEYTNMLSEYMTTHLSNNGLNTSFMTVKNVACELHIPKGRDLIKPYLVTQVVFSSSPAAIRTF